MGTEVRAGDGPGGGTRTRALLIKDVEKVLQGVTSKADLAVAAAVLTELLKQHSGETAGAIVEGIRREMVLLGQAPRVHLLADLLTQLAAKADVDAVVREAAGGLNLLGSPEVWSCMMALLDEHITRASMIARRAVMCRIMRSLTDTPAVLYFDSSARSVLAETETSTSMMDMTKLEVSAQSIGEEQRARAQEWFSEHTFVDGLFLLRCAQQATALLLRYFSDNLVPPYLIAVDIKRVMVEVDPNATEAWSQHWVLRPFVEKAQARKFNLASILTVDGAVERCRVLSLQNEQDLVTQRFLHEKFIEHQVVDDWTCGLQECGQAVKLNQQGTRTVLHMLCEQFPLDDLFRVIFSNFELVAQTGKSPNNKPTGKAQYSQLLLDACVLRIIQLVEVSLRESQQKNKGQPRTPGVHTMDVSPVASPAQPERSLSDLYTDWWGEWVRFANQFHHFIEHRLINFEEFVCKLSQAKLRSGQPLKSNCVVWLLGQCMPTEPLKEIFKKDVLERNGWLLSMVMNMYDREEAENNPMTLRDSAIDCLIFRVRTVISSPQRSPLIVQDLPNLKSDVTRHRQWWQANKTDIDFHALSVAGQISICVLSSISSEPIARRICTYLANKQPAVQLLPGGVRCSGDSRPLPTILLANLALKSRSRVLETLEQLLYSRSSSDATALGLVGTYTRLMTLAGTLYLGLIGYLRSANVQEVMKLHTVIESISYRLLPMIAFNRATQFLASCVVRLIVSCKHNQLHQSLQILQLKTLWNVRHLMKWKVFLMFTETDCGPMLTRAALLALARGLQLHRLSDYSLTVRLPELFSRFNSVHHVWDKCTLRFFPKHMQLMHDEYYSNPDSALHAKPSVTLQQAVDALREKPDLTFREGADIPGLIEYYKDKKMLFMCAVWLLRCSSGADAASPSTDIVLKVLQTFAPQERHVYDFVDFVLDESLPRTPKSKEGSSYYAESADHSMLATAASLLAKFVWQEGFLPFEETAMALTDRMADPNASQLLRSLLLVDGQLIARVECFLATDMKWNYWESEDCYLSQATFYRQYPLPTWGNQPPLPVYFGNICLRFLPVCDYVLCRLIEFENGSFFDEMISAFRKLYAFHQQPVSFVKDTLYYYHQSTFLSTARKINLLSLLAPRPVSFSGRFRSLLESSNSQEQFLMDVGMGMDGPSFDQEYFQELLAKLTAVTDANLTGEARKSMPYHTFREFNTQVDEVLATAVVELLVINVDAEEAVKEILRPLSLEEPHVDASFALLNAAGLLIASLPRHFVRPAILHCMTLLVSEAHVASLGSGNPLGAGPFSSRNFADHSFNSDSCKLSTVIDCTKTFLHSLFYYGSIEVFSYFPEVITFVKERALTYQHLLLLCQLVGPWMYRIRMKNDLFDKVFIALFEYLRDVDRKSSTQAVRVACDPRRAAASVGQTSWIVASVVDFFHHCHYPFIQSPARNTAVRAILPSLSAPLRAQLKNLGEGPKRWDGV